MDAMTWPLGEASSHLQVTKHDGVHAVRFLDHQLGGNLPLQLGQEFHEVAAQDDCTKVLLNFSGVDFLASDMLGAVVSLHTKMKKKAGKLVLCEICPHIREVLATTKLDTVFTVRATEADGMAALA